MRKIALSSEQGKILNGIPIYDENEYSFSFKIRAYSELDEREGFQGRASLSVGTLQLEVDIETGIILYAWGLHPKLRWRAGECCPGSESPGIVRAFLEPGFDAGTAVAIAEVGDWNTIYDEASGWVQIGRDFAIPDESRTLIATGTVLGLTGGILNSIWIRPRFEGSL